MRTEQLFSQAGYYRFLLDSNVLLHRDAVEAAQAALRQVLSRHAADPMRVLDLACGGLPVTVASLIARFPARAFHYTGIDVNPDQLALARTEFTFPDNVQHTIFIEGNAWDLAALKLDNPFHLVFSGMNLHHGTPEEIRFLGLQLRDRISIGGAFISHDVYRPNGTPYRRRPEVNPDPPGESFRLVAAETLQAAGAAALDIRVDTGADEPAWRRDYLEHMYRTLLARGAEARGAEETVRHMRQRDYPISTNEFRRIFEDLGFRVTIERFADSTEPLGPYVALCAASVQTGGAGASDQ